MDTADRGAEGKQRQDPAVPTGCAEVRDFLPLISEREVPSEVGAHLDGCAECSAEAEFVSRVASLRPDPPRVNTPECFGSCGPSPSSGRISASKRFLGPFRGGGGRPCPRGWCPVGLPTRGRLGMDACFGSRASDVVRG